MCNSKRASEDERKILSLYNGPKEVSLKHRQQD